MRISVFELKCLTNTVLSLAGQGGAAGAHISIDQHFKFEDFKPREQIRKDYLATTTSRGTSEQIARESEEIDLWLGLKYASKKFDIKDKDSTKALVDYIYSNSQKFYHFLEWAPKTILPQTDTCCNKKLKLNAGRDAKIFGKVETQNGKTYTATCKECGIQYGHGYKELRVSEGERRRYYTMGRFFVFTQGSVFEDVFLREITRVVVLSRSKFSQIADIYNGSRIKSDSLDPDILLNTFTVWNISRRLPGIGFLIKRVSITNRHQNVEALCSEVIQDLLDTFRVWVKHKCNEIGCKARVAICDGNFKNKRKICAAPGDKIIQTDKARFNVYKKCIKNPVRGDRSIFCEDHCKDGTPKEGETIEQQDLRPETRRWAKEMEDRGLLPTVDDMTEIGDPDGCRKPEMVNKVIETEHGLTSAGILMWVRPCLLRLHLSEIYHAESLTQWATSLIDTFTVNPDPEEIKYVCGDRVCEFCPFCEKKAASGNEVLQKYLDIVDGFPLDKFHGDKHVKPQCQPSGTEAKYNARLPKFEKINGTNYEAAEQTFRKINEFNGSTNYMTYSKRICVMTIINDEFNAWRESSLDVIISVKDQQNWRKDDEIVQKKSEEWKKDLVGLLNEN